MFDVDSIPEMYETMIDRPAFIFDSLNNLTYSFTKNTTRICSFLVEQLNYTIEQCHNILSNSHLDGNHVSDCFFFIELFRLNK